MADPRFASGKGIINPRRGGANTLFGWVWGVGGGPCTGGWCQSSGVPVQGAQVGEPSPEPPWIRQCITTENEDLFDVVQRNMRQLYKFYM